ncbi:hypothetical protein FHR81_002063 [Actinoalloteichus hoggarensis]|uniref:Uncharacterized protein n=1 Tax=Actinoalloteichus hoggarensis TaxID=1470176 RepID=A0A221W5H1_9PSEU|nr:hypothetical protein AHOG_17350 [Actinoalloteichus hoggarensis]MBB5921025.1 hypothetical protein [Actinoalloteichus hoggarensis]
MGRSRISNGIVVNGEDGDRTVGSGVAAGRTAWSDSAPARWYSRRMFWVADFLAVFRSPFW